jgi:hypothetical protein
MIEKKVSEFLTEQVRLLEQDGVYVRSVSVIDCGDYINSFGKEPQVVHDYVTELIIDI